MSRCPPGRRGEETQQTSRQWPCSRRRGTRGDSWRSRSQSGRGSPLSRPYGGTNTVSHGTPQGHPGAFRVCSTADGWGSSFRDRLLHYMLGICLATQQSATRPHPLRRRPLTPLTSYLSIRLPRFSPPTYPAAGGLSTFQPQVRPGMRVHIIVPTSASFYRPNESPSYGVLRTR